MGYLVLVLQYILKYLYLYLYLSVVYLFPLKNLTVKVEPVFTVQVMWNNIKTTQGRQVNFSHR